MSGDKTTTKYCPNCGNDRLILLRTMNKKCCLDCHTDMDWFLDVNQKPVGYSQEKNNNGNN